MISIAENCQAVTGRVVQERSCRFFLLLAVFFCEVFIGLAGETAIPPAREPRTCKGGRITEDPNERAFLSFRGSATGQKGGF